MRRRDFLKATATLAAGSLLAPVLGAARAKYNVLMIPVDDLKPLLGCYGNKDILTPNIDRLAARGTVFLNNACQQAVCGPTRASLMTGMYPDHTGVWDLKTRMRDVNPDILSMPQYFIQNGYETTGLGKTYDTRCVDKKRDAPSWSIPYGSERFEYNPATPKPVRGYLRPETQEAQKRGRAAIKGKKFRSGSARNRAIAKVAGEMAAPATECMDVPDDAYGDGALAAAGCRQLEKLAAGSKPFFLSVGFHKPHLPFVAPKRYWDLYDRDKIALAPFQEHSKNAVEIAYHTSGELRSYSNMPDTGDFPTEQQAELIHGYRACVSYVDAQIGKLLDKLDALGLTDKTVVCLWGDHGWHLGDHAMWCKHSNFEQAVRAPLIVAAPGQPVGRKTDAPTAFVDVFPTLCDLAGLSVPKHLPGKSLVPLIADPSGSVREASLSQYPRRIDGQPVMGYTLRDRRYRYVKWLQMNFRAGERKGLLVGHELYDYETDPHETVNQADNPEFTAVVARFEGIFKEMGVAQDTGSYLSASKMAERDGVGRMLLNGAGTYVTARTVAVTDQPFAAADEVTVTTKPEKTAGAAYKRLVMIPVKTGETYRVRFYCRSEAGAEFNAIWQSGGPKYTKIARQRVKADGTWQKIELIGKPEEDYAPGKTVLTCHLGEQMQTVKFAGVSAEEIE